MHDDEFPTSVNLVRGLLEARFPQWASLPITPVSSTGTSNAMFRLGEEMAVRLPLRPGSEPSLRKEMRWLPELAPALPLVVPTPVAIGDPTQNYSSAWAVVPWLPGEDGSEVAEADSAKTARDLARFLGALHGLPVAIDAPRSASSPSDRGAPLAARDEVVRHYAERARHLTDADVVLAIWDEALEAPTWDEPGVWIHGDIAAGNLLFIDGQLSAAIDWSPMAVGDPAADLIVAWEMFGSGSRSMFLEEVDAVAPYAVDEAMVARARGWTMSTAIMALPYYEHTNVFMVDQAQRKIAALLSD